MIFVRKSTRVSPRKPRRPSIGTAKSGEVLPWGMPGLRRLLSGRFCRLSLPNVSKMDSKLVQNGLENLLSSGTTARVQQMIHRCVMAEVVNI